MVWLVPGGSGKAVHTQCDMYDEYGRTNKMWGLKENSGRGNSVSKAWSRKTQGIYRKDTSSF